jgi:hypothetical protein
MWVAPHLTGGLGNRLFQYAAAAGLGEKWNREVVFFLPRCSPTGHGPFDTVFRLFPEVAFVETAAEWETLPEEKDKLFRYCPFQETGPDANCVIHGYRQSEKYFPKGGIQPHFENALGAEKFAALELKNPETQWFIHIRLGDYKILPHHQEDLRNYYIYCMQQIPKNHTLTLYSDEPELCAPMFKEIARALALTMEVSTEKDELATLYRMSQCRGGTIAANSTFSWWASYLAHKGGCKQSFFPLSWGRGLPPPVDLLPQWGTIVEI